MFAPEVPQAGGPRRQVSSPRRGVLNQPSMAAVMSEEELEHVMENFAKEDAYFAKTWSRIVVEKFLGKVCGCVKYIVGPALLFVLAYEYHHALGQARMNTLLR